MFLFRLHYFFYTLASLKLDKPNAAVWNSLYRHFRFFRHLDQKERYRFYLRCKAFIRTWEFHGRQGFQLREEHKFLIAASYVKLTFGRSYQDTEIFFRILVYPKPYYSRITRQYHKGETNRRGLVVLSWEDYLHGLKVDDDNLHLGIHEFAHVLMIESEIWEGTQYESEFGRWLRKWKQASSNQQVSDFLNRQSYLRDYSRRNQFELFAVMTESFFETPSAFRQVMPGMYAHFAKMYHLNPDEIYRRTPQPNILP